MPTVAAAPTRNVQAMPMPVMRLRGRLGERTLVDLTDVAGSGPPPQEQV